MAVGSNTYMDCIKTPYSLTRKGYGDFRFNGVHVNHHRAVYCEIHGKTLDEIKGFQVMHTCDNRWCINPEHLELGTNQDNVTDKMTKNRHVGGGRPVVTDVAILELIREQRANKAPVEWIAKQHEISVTAVLNIVNRVGRYK
jgi:hypothetical protein